MKKIWRCTICNYEYVGETPPEKCPVCGAGPEKFILVGEAQEFPQELTAEEEEEAKKAINKITYGLYIVGSPKDNKLNAQVCNTVFQITSRPMRVAVGINKGNLTAEHVLASRVFSINVLDKDSLSLVKHFGYRSGREVNKFEGIEYTVGKTGSPLLPAAIAYLECRVLPDKVVDCGTHWLFVADVVGGKLIREAEAMTYDYYRKIK